MSAADTDADMSNVTSWEMKGAQGEGTLKAERRDKLRENAVSSIGSCKAFQGWGGKNINQADPCVVSAVIPVFL